MASFSTGDGIRLHYERVGSGSPVFVLDGGPANDFRYLIEDLAPLATDYAGVFHDYRGSGRSESAPPDTYTVQRLAGDLDELRAALGDEKIVVLAHSMGGLVAQAYALRYPEHCERLVLVGTFPTTAMKALAWPTLRALGPVRFAKLLARAGVYLVAYSWRRPSAERDRRGMSIMATTQEGRGDAPARLNERNERLGLPLKNDNIEPLMKEIFSGSLSFVDELHSIACPVLVLYGTRDAIPAAGAKLFREGLRHPTIVALDGIGHEPFFEVPDEACAVVRSFLT